MLKDTKTLTMMGEGTHGGCHESRQMFMAEDGLGLQTVSNHCFLVSRIGRKQCQSNSRLSNGL